MYQYEYPRPALAVDLIVIRHLGQQSEILLIKRKNDPFAGAWALPGGFLDENETLEDAAARELMEETNATATSLKQFNAYSHPDRDPRTRVISVVFAADVKAGQSITAGDDAADAKWFDIDRLPTLAFDHDEILHDFLSSDSSIVGR